MLTTQGVLQLNMTSMLCCQSGCASGVMRHLLLVSPATPLVQQQQLRARKLSGLAAGSSFHGFGSAALTRKRLKHVATSRLCAKRRLIEPAYFGDLFDAMAEMVMEKPTDRLPHMDMLIMIRSIESMQEAAKVLGLIARQVVARKAAGEEDTDWHLRKKYLVALIEVTWQQLKAPQLAFEVMANPSRYATATYFCSDVLAALSALRAPPEMLVRVAEINRMQHPAGHKGVKAAVKDLAAALKAQNANGPLRQLVQSQQGLKDGVRFAEDIKVYVRSLPPMDAPSQVPTDGTKLASVA